MSIPGRYRFTLGQSMAVTAIVAVLIYADLSKGRYPAFADPRFLVSTAVHFAGAGVCFYSHRLSPGMWLVFVGYIGQWLVDAATRLVAMVWSSALNGTFVVNLSRASWLAHVVFSLLVVTGLATTFRDIRRRLATLEDAA